MPAAPTPAERTPRRRGRRTGGGSNGRAIVRALALAGLAALAVAGYRAWDGRRATLLFVRGDGAPTPPLALTLFADQLAFAAPSPPPPLGERALPAGAAATFTRGDAPERAVVRYEGPGIGAGFVHFTLGEERPPIVLRPATPIRGRIVAPLATWLFGWRCAGLQPLADAEVLVMGGGEHGIALGRATTAADGSFAIDGVDGALDGLALRVRAAGHVLAHAPIERHADGAPAPTLVPLERGALRTGRITAPAGCDVTQLLVVARGLPGVQAKPAADGSFALDHLPPLAEPRLCVHGLPDLLAHRPVRAAANATTAIELVPAASLRGRVVSVAGGKPLAGALVWIGDDDEVVRTDDDGCFELRHQLPGAVEVRAQWNGARKRGRRAQWLGSARAVLAAGQTLDGVEIVVTEP